MAEEILGKDQPLDLCFGLCALQQNMAQFAEQLRVAGKKADRVVARRHWRRTRRVDASIGRPKAIEAAERGWHADRSCRVRAKREVAHRSGHRRSRTARRAAGYVLRRERIDRLAVMDVRAEHAIKELVAHG